MSQPRVGTKFATTNQSWLLVCDLSDEPFARRRMDGTSGIPARISRRPMMKKGRHEISTYTRKQVPQRTLIIQQGRIAPEAEGVDAHAHGQQQLLVCKRRRPARRVRWATSFSCVALSQAGLPRDHKSTLLSHTQTNRAKKRPVATNPKDALLPQDKHDTRSGYV